MLSFMVTRLSSQSHLRVGEVRLDLLEQVLPVPVPPIGLLPHVDHALALPELGPSPGGRQFQQGDIVVGPFDDLVRLISFSNLVQRGTGAAQQSKCEAGRVS